MCDRFVHVSRTSFSNAHAHAHRRGSAPPCIIPDLTHHIPPCTSVRMLSITCAMIASRISTDTKYQGRKTRVDFVAVMDQAITLLRQRGT